MDSLSEEEKFWLTPVGKSVVSWLQFMQRAMSFGDAASRGVSTMVPVAKLFAKYPRLVRLLAPKAMPQIEQAVALGEEQLKENFSFLNALTLMAAWGSFEAFVEDFCLAVLMEDQSALRSEPLSKLKVEIGTLFTPEVSVFEDILQIGYNRQGSALKEGSGSFESRLKLVQLDGGVPGELANEIFVAQKVRNVWAHRSGKADRKFIEKTSNLPGFYRYSPGESVEVSSAAVAQYLTALSVYAVVIVNRYRSNQGLGRMDWPGGRGGTPSFNETHIELYGEPVDLTDVCGSPDTSPS